MKVCGTLLTPAARTVCAAACWAFLLFSPSVAAPAAAEVQLNAVSPGATDVALAGSAAPHRVYFDPAAPSRNQLLVFLPGTGGLNTGAPSSP